MARIPPVDDAQFCFREGSGAEAMAMLFRSMAQRPALAEQSMQLLETAMRQGTVEPTLKELLAVRVSQVNHCLY